MQNRKSLSLQIAGAVALATLFGTSAFAESRHHEGTSRGSGGHIDRGSSRSSGSSQPRERSVAPSESRSSDRGSWRGSDTSRNIQRDVTPRENTQRFESRDATPRENTQRFESREVERNNWRGNNQRNESRNNGNNDRRNEWRNNGNNDRRNESRANAGRSEGRGGSNRGFGERSAAFDRFHHVEGWRPGGRAPYRYHERVSSWGRVDRFERFHNGYRVWIGGGLFPIFVPFERWRLFPLRVGLTIRFGGFWDPLGYWSVYDYSPYDGYYDGYGTVGAYRTSGDVRGVVESVDYRRGTLVLNDDISRQFVTVTMPRDRRMEDVRPGDFIEFAGDWTRNGVFNAYRIERLDYDRDRY